MAWIIQILTAVLRAFIPAMMDAAEPTSEESMRRPELRKRLQGRIHKTWGTVGRAGAAVLLVTLLTFSGCVRTRTIYVPPGEPVKLRQTVRNVKVWVVDKNGTPVAGRMDLPEGWFCLPDTGPDE